MRITTNAPTQPGFYWCRVPDSFSNQWCVVYVFYKENELKVLFPGAYNLAFIAIENFAERNTEWSDRLLEPNEENMKSTILSKGYGYGPESGPGELT